ncbi:uncharacterized protein LOC112569238 isoform X1 [Pomacea canaliculata]|uniref:uncharacterized protein LOC112569238 isoform X1 n=1 Tax=Pomacea canaliculata TaxID=400727 RepID=UPI000D73F458|nr:uncharacterized protein LOC112569238 isoform X1 [Pomacea canaliculata]
MGCLVPCIFTILFIVVFKESLLAVEGTDSLDAWEYQCEIKENVTDVLWILQFSNDTETLSRCLTESEICDLRLDDCAIATINSKSSLLNISDSLVKEKVGRVGYAEIISGKKGDIRFDATNRSITWACVPLPETSTSIAETPTTSQEPTTSTESTTTTWETSITSSELSTTTSEASTSTSEASTITTRETSVTSGEVSTTTSEPSTISNNLSTETSEAVITSEEPTITIRETFTSDNYLSTIPNEASTATSEGPISTSDTSPQTSSAQKTSESLPITEPSTTQISTTSNKSETTSDQSTQSIHQQDSDGGVPAGAIAGIVVAIIAICLIVAAVFVMYKRRQREKPSFPAIDHNAPDEAVVVDCVNPVYKTSETSPDESLPTAADTQKSQCDNSQPQVVETGSLDGVNHYATTSTTLSTLSSQEGLDKPAMDSTSADIHPSATTTPAADVYSVVDKPKKSNIHTDHAKPLLGKNMDVPAKVADELYAVPDKSGKPPVSSGQAQLSSERDSKDNGPLETTNTALPSDDHIDETLPKEMLSGDVYSEVNKQKPISESSSSPVQIKL